MSAKAAKRELAEALRGYPWERWSTRSVVWAARMLERSDRPWITPNERRYQLAYALRGPWVPNERARASAARMLLDLVVRLESAVYLWEHSREPDVLGLEVAVDHPIAGTLTSVPAGTVDE